ncbi:ANTAR domain-containing protein [Streptomyces sp. NPDC007808]|uniref:ANTAR domain-containing protein n=1 Tax=Streptomyces sp. NPDC007808 TaxID=3364779 RepID=UPI003682818A
MPELTSVAHAAEAAADRVDTDLPPAVSAPCPLVTTFHLDGDRAVVKVRGELDLDNSERLGSVLREALSRSARGVHLDLADVSFCDCSMLNILLTLRRQALKQAKTVTVHSAGTVVDRLLALTGTRTLFAGSGPDGECAWDPHPQDAEVAEGLRMEVAQLRRAMQTRPTIDLARGILMASFRLNSDEAWTVLVSASQNTNTKLHCLAGELVTAVKGGPLPDEMQEHLSAAIDKVTSAAPER